MARLSIDNGTTWLDSVDVLDLSHWPYISPFWEQIVDRMADDIRAALHKALAPCDEMDFLAAYLEHPEAADIVIG